MSLQGCSSGNAEVTPNCAEPFKGYHRQCESLVDSFFACTGCVKPVSEPNLSSPRHATVRPMIRSSGHEPSIKEIYLAAIELQDVEQRNAFLDEAVGADGRGHFDEACGGREGLEAHVY